MSIYKPTWLYIKQHNQTGLKYFGKTTLDDPLTYAGSGKYWKLHLAKHGADVKTLWCHRYDDETLLKEEAMAFSLSHNITESDEWANLKPETGIDGGGMFGHITSDDTKKKIGDANRGRKMSSEFCEMRAKVQSSKVPWNKGTVGLQKTTKLGKKYGPLPENHRLKVSAAMTGKIKQVVQCPHCNKEGGKPVMVRFHFDNCKSKP